MTKIDVYMLVDSFWRWVHYAGQPTTSVTYLNTALATVANVQQICTRRMLARVVRKTASVTWVNVPRSTTNVNRFGVMVSIIF